ncbi:hypothetical protein ACFXPR_21930 [Nocardia tengchongensis]|uniref:hypothetical protein n=1 Tax=Nocardia tengchongensis TaxID=2055889 RepID=UPI0036C3D22A
MPSESRNPLSDNPIQRGGAAGDQEWADHLGERRMRNLREALVQLRNITDPYA